ncbi:copper homeostasis protein CutC [Tenacibaculum sp. SZ-18]|uniref:copper homeostasis protein CutC n=1 Tax=Tenacibaculum sp. SZ-18 TaxID=754423 RepID=UPI000C2D59E5|nr:copper homeostasis protein CutC [Tenacibaculum sp. SZ-18]AUC14743.1 copper homeostasis protein CutC [Tenacibaculum sp. SZ-18]
MKLEICANSYQSALNAEQAGAHRIELCSELNSGGITPSYGLIKKVISELSIETFVLIRPRSGNFVYSKAEFDIMKQDIIKCKSLGVNGIVSGVLKDNNTIDEKRSKELISLAYPLPFTFHRAFDLITNPIEGIQQLINLNVNRVLTSGQKNKALEGLTLLKDLQKEYSNQIIILPGSGINSKNVGKLKKSGFIEVHASASINVEESSASNFDNIPQTVSDSEEIRKILNVITSS